MVTHMLVMQNFLCEKSFGPIRKRRKELKENKAVQRKEETRGVVVAISKEISLSLATVTD
jgi:hypothetical protein